MMIIAMAALGWAAWFGSLRDVPPTLAKVYVFCLVVGLGYTVLAALLGSLGSDHGHFDFGHDLEGGGGLDVSADHGEAAGPHVGAHVGPFSPLIMALFLTCFGGTGLIFSGVIPSVRMGAWSVAPASGSSLLFAAAAIWAFNRLFARVEADSQARACDLVGRQATVIVPIPKGPGAGQVAFVVKGARYTLTARSEDAVAMARGDEAIVLRVVGRSCFVAPPADPRAEKAARLRANANSTG